jgi:hypothetical protein
LPAAYSRSTLASSVSRSCRQPPIENQQLDDDPRAVLGNRVRGVCARDAAEQPAGRPHRHRSTRLELAHREDRLYTWHGASCSNPPGPPEVTRLSRRLTRRAAEVGRVVPAGFRARECQLVAVHRDCALAQRDPCVVDEHVDRGVGAEARRELPDGFQAAQVAEADVNIAVTRPGDDSRPASIRVSAAAGWGRRLPTRRRRVRRSGLGRSRRSRRRAR